MRTARRRQNVSTDAAGRSLTIRRNIGSNSRYPDSPKKTGTATSRRAQIALSRLSRKVLPDMKLA